MLEIAVNQGHGAQALDLAVGDEVTITMDAAINPQEVLHE
jgi:S-adenosylmethionine hydrolase